MQKLVLFQVSGMKFGVDMALTRTIEARSALHAHESNASNMQALVFDGAKVPIYDLSTIVDDETFAHDSRSRKVMLVKAQGQYLALLVDRVEQSVEVESRMHPPIQPPGYKMIEPLPPIFNGPVREYFPDVLKREDGLVLILNPEALVSTAPPR